MAGYIDLKNLVDAQRVFINSAGAIGSGMDSTNRLDLSLNQLSTSLNNASNSIGPTLTYQSDVQSILSREQARLDAKKSTIDAAYSGQKRMVDLTNSSTKKSQAYNLILMIAVITFLIVLGIKQVYDNGIIPNTVLDIMNIVIVAGGIIYCVVLYVDVYNRSNMDFDQIVLDSPYRKSQAELDADQAKALSSGSLSAATAAANAGCVGAQCCPTGTTFNEYNHICVPNVAPFGTTGYVSATWKPFYNTETRDISWRNPATATPGCVTADKYDPLKLACKTEGFTTLSNTSESAQPYTPCEFNQYNKYNGCGSKME